MAFRGDLMIKEFCAENYLDIPTAIKNGANRIELCDNLAVGARPLVKALSRPVSPIAKHVKFRLWPWFVPVREIFVILTQN